MELVDWAKELPSMGVHGMLILWVYILYKRQSKLEQMLYDCIGSGGKVEAADIDSLP